MTLGERLRCLRQRSGLSQEEVAQDLFVSRQSVSKWELDQSEPGVENLRALAKLYGVTLDELLEGESPDVPARQESCEPALEEDGEESARRYRNIVWFRTAVVVVSNLIASEINFPFDWLVMLVGLFVRNSTVWTIITVLIVLNIIVTVISLAANPIGTIIGLILHVLTLRMFSRREVKAYFQMSEEKEE